MRRIRYSNWNLNSKQIPLFNSWVLSLRELRLFWISHWWIVKRERGWILTQKKNSRNIIALREANHYNLMFIIILKEKKRCLVFCPILVYDLLDRFLNVSNLLNFCVLFFLLSKDQPYQVRNNWHSIILNNKK